jgi:hypothetical protein
MHFEVESAEYKEILDEAICIGKTLGDGYAWIFYGRDREMLNKHYDHPAEFHMPTGIGGHGELAFIKNIKALEGQFVLYHGMTSYLSLGDVSLVDLEANRVSAIGEIKTQKGSNSELSITVHFIGNKDVFAEHMERLSAKVAVADVNDHVSLSPKQKDRFERQMKRIGKSFGMETQSAANFEHTMNCRFRCLNSLWNSLQNEEVAYEREEGVVFVGFRQKGEKLSDRLFGCGDGKRYEFSGLPEIFLDTQVHDSEWNMFVTNIFHYEERRVRVLRGMTPLAWWPVDLDALRAIIFMEIGICTLFNPAKLFEELQEHGFDVTRDKTGRISISKSVGKNKMMVEGIDYFRRLITDYMLSESDVVQLLIKMTDSVTELDLRKNHRVKLDLRQQL